MESAPHKSPPRMPCSAVVAAVAVAASVGAVSEVSAVGVRVGPTRAVAQRQSAVKWFGAITEAARRLHGQYPPMAHTPRCAVIPPISADVAPPPAEHSPIPSTPHVGLHLIDLPPPTH